MTATAIQGPSGGPGGDFFDDDNFVDKPITRIAVWFYNNSIIARLEVDYAGETQIHGSHDYGIKEEFTLNQGERIVSVQGTYGDRLCSLQFSTDQGRTKLFGKPVDRQFWYGGVKGYYVAGFIGRAGADCDALGVILKGV